MLTSDDIYDIDFSAKIGGSQPKTVNVNNQYIKFDKIEYNEFGKIDYAFSYPSITEGICSTLIRNSNIKDRIRCANYYIGEFFNENGDCKSISISENYRQKFEDEYRLASPFGTGQMPFTLMKTEDYRNDIFETISPQNSKNIIIDTIIKNFNCDKNYIEKQFNDKCAVDILLNNKDIRNNHGNFIVVCDDSKRNKPNIVCMDYGRCLHFGKTNTYVSELDLKDFEPFQINLKCLKKECEQIKLRIRNEELKSLANSSIDKLLENLENHQNLWIDINS